ncbi:hypothetical protein ACEWPN_12135 [Yoonia sp. R2-816]
MNTIASALEALMSISAKDHDDAADINLATACLFRIQKRHASPVASAPLQEESTRTDQNIAPEEANPGKFRYADLPISEVAVLILKNEAGGKAMKMKDLIEAAQAGGYRFDGANPHQSARAAFIRRGKGHGDLIQVSRSHWGLRDWYTQREITQFKHADAIRSGQESGKSKGTWSPKGWAISEEQASAIKAKIANGEKLSTIAREYSLTVNTIHRYKKLLADWSLGDPFPPKKKDESEVPKLRAVE